MPDKELLTLSTIIPASEVRRNPLAAEAEQEIELLCRRYGVLQPHFYEYNNIVSYMYPTASYERLVIAGLLFNTLLYIDDVYEDAMRTEISTGEEARKQQALNQKFENSIRILLTGRQPKTGGDFFLYDIAAHLHQALAPHGGGRWLKRMVMGLVKYLRMVALDNSEVIVDGKMNVTQYIKFRHLDSAMDPTMDMLEYARDIYLPDPIVADEYIQTMRGLCARVGAMMNDIFSYEKEVVQLGSRFNLIVAYMEDYGVSFEQAVENSINMVNETTQAFAQLKCHIPDYGNAGLQRDVLSYLDGLEDLGSSTWHWQIRTNRYRSINSPFKELRTLLPEKSIEINPSSS